MFSYPALRALKRQLGELDAICECLELAARDFEAHALAAQNVDAFVTQRSNQHGISVATVDLKDFRRHAACLYIVSVQQGLEGFLRELKREHPDGDKWALSNEDDRLTETAQNVALQPTLSFDVCQYYRLVRNAFVHPAARDKPRDRVRQALRARMEAVESLRHLAAPNEFDAVSFDDFVLFTRCAKDIAAELCSAGRPSDEQLRQAALRHVFPVSKEGTTLRGGKGRRLAKNSARLRRSMAGYLATTYSLGRAEADTIVAACEL